MRPPSDDEAAERIARMQAHTLSGMLAKLALIASDFDDNSASGLPAEIGMSEEILFSVALGLQGDRARCLTHAPQPQTAVGATPRLLRAPLRRFARACVALDVSRSVGGKWLVPH